jgi:uncharacterized protein with GYD domain
MDIVAYRYEGGREMAHYVLLINWTDEGIRNIKTIVERISATEQLFQNKYGAKLEQVFMTMGRYDTVSIWEAPNDESMTKAVLALGSQGNVRTETLRAYSREELSALVAEL